MLSAWVWRQPRSKKPPERNGFQIVRKDRQPKLFYDVHDAAHDYGMPRESADVRVIARIWGSELYGSPLAMFQHG